MVTSLTLPFVKHGDKPEHVAQEAWDQLKALNDVYVFDDQWMHSLMVNYVAYRIQFVEEGPETSETQIPYRDFKLALAKFNINKTSYVDKQYQTQIPPFTAQSTSNPDVNPWSKEIL